MPLDLTDDKSILVQVMAGAVRQQAITWANVDPYLCLHMVSLGHNEFQDCSELPMTVEFQLLSRIICNISLA